MQFTITTPTTRRDLAAAGFTQPEITRLQQLKDRYDGFQEYCESNREYEQLRFLRWRYEQGEIREATTG